MAGRSAAALVLVLVLALALTAGAAANRPWTFGRRFGNRFFPLEPQPAASQVSAVSRLADSASRVAAAPLLLDETGPTPLDEAGFADPEGVPPTASTAGQMPTEAPFTGTTAGWGTTVFPSSTVHRAPEPHTTSAPTTAADTTATDTTVADTTVADTIAADTTAAESAASAASTTPAVPRPTTASSALVFPDRRAPAVPEGEAFVPECDGVPYMARSADTGRCQFLMMRSDCAKGSWFILERDTHEAACRPLPCPDDEVLFRGECRPRDDQVLCPPGMVVLMNEYGEAACDCAVRHVYWPKHDRCYPAFREGPCGVGRYLTVGEEGARCSPNVCVRDGAVLWPAARRCFRLRDETDSPCRLGRLDVGVDSLELECVETELFAIFDLPIVRCSKGSKLDYSGRCKRELYQKFRSSFATDASKQKRCPEGFIAGASGRCLKAELDPSRLG